MRRVRAGSPDRAATVTSSTRSERSSVSPIISSRLSNVTIPRDRMDKRDQSLKPVPLRALCSCHRDRSGPLDVWSGDFRDQCLEARRLVHPRDISLYYDPYAGVVSIDHREYAGSCAASFFVHKPPVSLPENR